MSQKQKNVHSWKLFVRKNMGSSANWRSKPPAVLYVITCRKRMHLKEWVENNGDPTMTYLVEHWINDKRKNGERVEYLCCGISEKKEFSFTDKWVWNRTKGWHCTGYFHHREGTKTFVKIP
jgi:hypothetical protein